MFALWLLDSSIAQCLCTKVLAPEPQTPSLLPHIPIFQGTFLGTPLRPKYVLHTCMSLPFDIHRRLRASGSGLFWCVISDMHPGHRLSTPFLICCFVSLGVCFCTASSSDWLHGRTFCFNAAAMAMCFVFVLQMYDELQGLAVDSECRCDQFVSFLHHPKP